VRANLLSPFALIPRSQPECPVVHLLSPLPEDEVATVPFIVDDEFHVFARERSLPPCALSFLMLAGSWSARESRSGFVPNSMLADFSDDFAQAERTLSSAGVLKRVKAGVRIAEGRGLTVVNAKDVHRDTEREAAVEKARQEKWRGDKQRQRAAKRAERRELIASGVSGVSSAENVDVHRENPAVSGKPQVNGSCVQVDIPKTSTKTPRTTASDYQDQSIGVGVIEVDLVNARPREAPSAGTIALVAAGLSKKRKRVTSEAEARRAIAVWDERAEKAGEVVHDPVKFYPTCIRRERDLEAILAPPANPLWEQLAAEPEPVPGGHVYVRDQRTGVCGHPKPDGEACGMPKSHAKHQNQGAMTG
jgi:hypothetical protein